MHPDEEFVLSTNDRLSRAIERRFGLERLAFADDEICMLRGRICHDPIPEFSRIQRQHITSVKWERAVGGSGLRHTLAQTTAAGSAKPLRR